MFINIKSWGKSWYVFLLNTSIIKIHGPIAGEINLFNGVWLVDRHEVHLLKGDTSVEILLVKTWHNAHSNDPQKAAKEVLISSTFWDVAWKYSDIYKRNVLEEGTKISYLKHHGWYKDYFWRRIWFWKWTWFFKWFRYLRNNFKVFFF